MHSHTLCRDGVMLRPDGMPYGIQSSRRLIGHHSDVCNFVRQCSECDLGLAFDLVGRLKALGFDVQPGKLGLSAFSTIRDKSQVLGQSGPPRTAGCCAAPWHTLPDDVLLHICSFLDCRSWHMMACSCAAWKSVITHSITTMSFVWASDMVNEVAIGAVLLFRALRQVSFARCRALTDLSLSRLVRASCSQLQVLDLTDCQRISNTGMVAVAHACGQLQELNISSCHLISDAGLIALGQQCHDLRVVKACGCDRLTDAGLAGLVTGTRQLVELNVGWCEDITTASLSILASTCSGLESLDLCGCSKVDDAAVQQLAQGCRQLQTLGLYCCGSLTDDAMHALAQHLPRLQHLNVSGCRKLTAPALQAVVDSNRQLHTCRNMYCNLICGGCLALLEVKCRCRH